MINAPRAIAKTIIIDEGVVFPIERGTKTSTLFIFGG